MMTRRDALKQAAQAASLGMVSTSPLFSKPPDTAAVEVNDVQSQLNRTVVREIVTPNSLDSIQTTLANAKRDGKSITVSGGRHSMGCQQFGTDAVLIDTREFNRVVKFDRAKGHIEVEGGIQWPELIAYLEKEQKDDREPWAIREKQTGVDTVTIAGSLASNIHGRGLRFPPIIGDVEAFVLVDADGKARTCNRRENAELFSLAIGGYGLFGIIAQVTLRLVRRTKVQRLVEVIPIKDLLAGVKKRIDAGFVYGDCQYSTDLDTEAASHPGVFSCYKPVAADTSIAANQKRLSPDDWANLYRLARTDKKKAFETYSGYYLKTSGQVYWSDTHQLAGNFEGYRKAVEKERGTEMITEVYVTPDNFLPFMAQVRRDYITHKVDMTYGTIRFIEKDTESFLAWAKEPSVCIVCNLHVLHTDEGKQKAVEDFRRIIDRVIEYQGRYYLTYHRWATRKQVETCYPQFVEFLRLKKKYDPQERLQSDWYRHYKTMFADKL